MLLDVEKQNAKNKWFIAVLCWFKISERIINSFIIVRLSHLIASIQVAQPVTLLLVHDILGWDFHLYLAQRFVQL